VIGRRALLGCAALGAARLDGFQAPALTVQQVLENAREALKPTCRVCQECDGVACSGEPGGIGGIGSGLSFQNNYRALQKVPLNLRTITDVKRADTSATLLGRKLSFPVMAAPMGPAATRFGKGITPERFFEAIVGGCAAAGTVGALGDTPTYPKEQMQSRWDLIARHGGKCIYGMKPIPNPALLKLIPSIEASGAIALSMDTDSAGRYREQDGDLRVEPKTVAQLREIARATRLPLLVKGIMTVDEAEKAVEAGCAGIVVSNHGGRVLDHTPGTADVLPAIARKVKGRTVILVDGCLRYGHDVLKYLALGADGVLAGRHLLRAAYGGGPEGVRLFMDRMRDEFARAMVLTGVPSVRAIDSRVIASTPG
jgi:4-hydroxymandelate oxidase